MRRFSLGKTRPLAQCRGRVKAKVKGGTVRAYESADPTAATAQSQLWPLIVALLCILPAVTMPVLPFIDFYAHTLRYDILADGGRDPGFAANYQIAWKLLPNLGLDVLGAALFRVLPELVAARLLVLMVIVAPIAGMLVLSRGLHGRVTPISIAVAGLVAHSFILSWGFANFLLGLALALAGIGCWIGQADRPRRQLAVAAVFGVVIFLTHGFVFALWGMLLFSVEVMEAIGGGQHRLAALGRRSLRLLVVAALPVLMFLATDTAQGAGGGVTTAFVNIGAQMEQDRFVARALAEIWLRLDAALRVSESNWPWADRLFGAVLWGLIGFGLVTRRFRLDRRLWLAAPLLLFIGIVVPPAMFGVGHLPERLPLVLLAILGAGIALAPDGRRGIGLSRALAVLLPLHLVIVTLGWAQERDGYARFLALAETQPAGGLGNVAYAPGAKARDEMRGCKPLTFLLGMTRGVAVPTFANPTQQPLAIVGPLAAAMARYDALEEASAGGLEGAAQVAAMMRSGFDLVVLCRGRYLGAGGAAPEVAGAVALGSGPDWTLYRAVRR